MHTTQYHMSYTHNTLTTDICKKKKQLTYAHKKKKRTADRFTQKKNSWHIHNNKYHMTYAHHTITTDIYTTTTEHMTYVHNNKNSCQMHKKKKKKKKRLTYAQHTQNIWQLHTRQLPYIERCTTTHNS